jgi:hypothetical protein
VILQGGFHNLIKITTGGLKLKPQRQCRVCAAHKKTKKHVALSGSKKAMDRVTVLCCKRKLVVIGKIGKDLLSCKVG